MTAEKTHKPETDAAGVIGSSGVLDELEAQLRRQEEFVAMLSSWTALPHILGGALREQARLKAAVKSENRCSSNAELSGQPPKT